MRARSLIVGSAVALVVAGSLVYGVAAGPLKSAPSHEVLISFPTGDGLVPGSDVFEAGAKVGSISSIEPQSQNDATYTGSGSSGDRALVTVSIENDHWPLHDALTAGIRPKSLLGEKYVDLHDAGTQVYPSAKVLVAAADSVPVELDQFINSLDAGTRTSAKVLLNDLGAGIAGRGVDLSQAIQTGRDNLAHLAVTGQTLNHRDPDLDRILVGLDGVLQKLTQNDQLTQLSQLISNGQLTLNAIEAERTSFSRSFVDAQAQLTDLNQALDPAIQSLRDTLNTSPHLLAVLGPEAQLLSQLASNLTTGNTIQVFQAAIAGGPTASGGALENTPTSTFPIFRVCLALPTQPASCTGNGFKPPASAGPQPVSSSTGAGGNNGASLTSLVGFLGA